jgi:ribosomal protein L20
MPLAKKKLFDLAKGFRDRSRNTIKAARRRVEKGLQYSTRDRKNKKRDFRSLWITQINAGVRQFDLTYSVFMQGLNRSGIALNRYTHLSLPSKIRSNFSYSHLKQEGISRISNK